MEFFTQTVRKRAKKLCIIPRAQDHFKQSMQNPIATSAKSHHKFCNVISKHSTQPLLVGNFMTATGCHKAISQNQPAFAQRVRRRGINSILF